MRFSVIMPLYNKAPYVKKAIDSVISQTFRDFEIVVIDDGSSDGSLSEAKAALSETSLPYQVIHQENAGVSTARNNGVAVSEGDYLCFLDADDWWAPTFLERMDGLIHDYPGAGAYGTNYYYVKNGRQRVCVTTSETGVVNYCKSYSERLQMPLWTGATCIHRAIYDEMGGFRPNLILGEDFDLWIKIALKHKVVFLNEPLAFYYQDSNPAWRLVGKLHDPSSHMLWNLEYLAEEERTNPDYKQLIDNLRTYDLLPYHLSRQYHSDAKRELDKVNWSRQPLRTRILYATPVPIIKCWMAVRKFGSVVKQWIMHR